LKEVIRLYPPGWAVARTVTTELELGGYRLPAGSNVVISQWVTHRDARFFPEPQCFNPDRWCSDAIQKLPKFAYFPFGAGPRGCIGSTFALMEAAVLLATVAQSFRLRAVPTHPVTPLPSVTLRPKNGIQTTLHRR
jgi:cytochrome P450